MQHILRPEVSVRWGWGWAIGQGEWNEQYTHYYNIWGRSLEWMRLLCMAWVSGCLYFCRPYSTIATSQFSSHETLLLTPLSLHCWTTVHATASCLVGFCVEFGCYQSFPVLGSNSGQSPSLHFRLFLMGLGIWSSSVISTWLGPVFRCPILA